MTKKRLRHTDRHTDRIAYYIIVRYQFIILNLENLFEDDLRHNSTLEKTLSLHPKYKVILKRWTLKATLKAPYEKKTLSLHSMYKNIIKKWKFKATLEDPYRRKKCMLAMNV